MSATDEDRWRLHRGGIVNIWQYDEQEFDLSGGRAVFQGTNGSGKSRTLELLLPLCLDGDLRQLGSKGFDTVSIRRLMLDDYDGGPNRIGYAWIELRRVDSLSHEHFLTCGIGIKASASAQQVSDSWRFITPERVGAGLKLIGRDRVPVGQAQLREDIGADAVLDDVTFRARIAELVYGMPTARYGDLLHLQRTLRNPDVGLKVLDGQLEQILSDALPPLDVTMIEQLAGSFEDLESIRENITRLSTADKALSAFLGGYGGYALAALRAATERARDTATRLAADRTEVRTLAEKLDRQRARHIGAEETVAAKESRVDDVDRALDALKELPAYLGLRDLGDRERLVAAARTAADDVLETAGKQRAHTERAVDAVLAMLRRLGEDAEAAARLADTTRSRLAEAGLDTALAPRVPAAPEPVARTLRELVRAKPDPEAAPVEVERRMPPSPRPDVLERDLTAAAEQAAELITIAGQRAALALSLRERAVELDRDRAHLDGLRLAARQAQLAATEAAGRRNEAAQRLEDAAAEWRERATNWLAGLGGEAGEPPTIEELRTGPDIARAAIDSARSAAAPTLRALRRAVAPATARVEAIAARIADTEAELIELRDGTSAAPPWPGYAGASTGVSVAASRDPGGGASFHSLVDFVPDLDAASRAGLEAALQGCGLLSAWVTATGVVDLPAELPEGLLAVTAAGPAPAVGAPATNLSAVLLPAVEPDCPVPAGTVRALLDAVVLAEDPVHEPAAGLVVSAGGRWRAGVLTGVMSKPAAEFVGAGARAAARARRMAELTAQLGELREARTIAEAELAGASETVASWERQLDAAPDDRALIAAQATLTTAVRTAEEATERAIRLRAEHESADRRQQAVEIDLTQSAAEAGLPADTDTLRRAHRAAQDARDGAEQLRDILRGRCVHTVAGLADALHDHQAAADDLAEAVTATEARCAEYAREQAALAELTGAIGGEAERVAGQLTELSQERDALRAELPGLRAVATDLSNQVVKTETVLESRAAAVQATADTARAAEEAARAALAAPGVWRAAVGDRNVPDDLDEAMDVLAGVERRAASEDTVITKLQTLQTALAGSFQITPRRHAGILTVVAAGESGPRPVAEAAALVRAKLTEQRGFLGERYQEIFATFMLRNLAERVSAQIAVAEDLTRRMNEVLDSSRSSQGVHVRLEWQPSPALDESMLNALSLVRLPFAERTEEQDARLRQAFTDRIDAERDAQSGGYAEILTRALDYRAWYRFTVRVRDHAGADSRPRVRRMRQLSSGETRLVSYVTLFAAAAAFYGAVSGSAGGQDPTTGPLRLVLLDEAFERLDDPTVARMLGLLVDLDMDWLITWPSGWGVSEKIPRMHIYDVLRPRSGRGVACTHTTWDGSALALTE